MKATFVSLSLFATAALAGCGAGSTLPECGAISDTLRTAGDLHAQPAASGHGFVIYSGDQPLCEDSASAVNGSDPMPGGEDNANKHKSGT
jgi:hypothetical protein